MGMPKAHMPSVVTIVGLVSTQVDDLV